MSSYYTLCKMDSDFVKHSREVLKEDFHVGLKNLDSTLIHPFYYHLSLRVHPLDMAAEECDPNNLDSSLNLRSGSKVVAALSNLYPF